MAVIAGERAAITQRTAQSEGIMNEKRSSRNPNWGLLLLIPAAVIIAKGASRRRSAWDPEGGHAWGAPGRGYGHHARFGGGDVEAEGPGAFQLPPRIERILDTWHARAHRSTEPIEHATA
jgi:hypothetical protein